MAQLTIFGQEYAKTMASSRWGRPLNASKVLCVLLTLLGGQLAVPSHALAIGDSERLTENDTIVIQPPGSRSRITIPCQIVDYNGSSIKVIIRPGEPPKTYPASQVVEVQTSQTGPHLKALKLYSQGKIEEARRAFNLALSAESREWVRRELLTILIRCSLRLGDYASAADEFLLLTKSDPKTQHFHLIPLIWTAQAAPRAARADARVWLLRSREVERLIGASYLIYDADYGRLAKRELEQLSSSTDRRIQQLAQAQLWRLRLKSTDDISQREMQRWQSHIDSMFEDLRGGPFYVLGQGYLKQHDYNRAAATLLWVPMIYNEDYQLAARACLEAADAVARVGRQRAAETLYREIQQRFADTTFAQDAESALQTMKNQRSESTSGNAAEPSQTQ